MDIRPYLLKRKSKIKTYVWLMNRYNELNGKIANDIEFKKKYRWFYGMVLAKSITPAMSDQYFQYMEDHYNEDLSFDKVLDDVSAITGRNEISFASKLLATINPNTVIWDRNIRAYLDIDDANDNAETKLLYKELCLEMIDIVESPAGQDWIKIFDELFGDEFDVSKITDVKKVDFVLWVLGGRI